jgi:rhodanese-related sulfurtransferase
MVFIILLSVFLFPIIHIGIAAASEGGQIGTITIQELKSSLEKHDLLIIDVRDPVGWSKSGDKILGAIREDPSDVTSWAKRYPKDKTIVLYCA